MSEIRNLDTDANAFKGHYNWGTTVVRSEDGQHWKYVGRGNSYMGSCTSSIALTAPVGHVIVLVAQTPDTSFATSDIWQTDKLLSTQDGDIYIKAGRVKETGKNHELVINACTTGVTILGSALYTPEDWEQVYDLYQKGALQYPWFAGDTIA